MTVPFDEFFTMIVAPITAPILSVTVPVTLIDCANASEVHNNILQSSRRNLLFISTNH